MHHERGNISWSALHSLRLKTDDSHEPGQPSSARALLNNFGHGGYAGNRVGEAENPGPATHDRDWTVPEKSNATHRRTNEAGDSAPTGQDSVTREVQLGLSCSTSGSASSATVNNEEFQKTATTETTAQRVPSLCTVRSNSHRSQSIHRRRSQAAHGAKTRRTATAPSSLGQLRRLDRAAWRRKWPDQITTMQMMWLLQQRHPTPWASCIASLPRVKLSPTCASGPTGERQEHLDVIVPFAGSGQKRRLFREIHILTIKRTTGD